MLSTSQDGVQLKKREFEEHVDDADVVDNIWQRPYRG
jgi:hypothetical protein